MVGGIFFMGNIDGLDGKFLRLILFPSISCVVLEGELDFFFFNYTGDSNSHSLTHTIVSLTSCGGPWFSWAVNIN